ncbi:MAG: lytic transglycosylase domain-containing protein [Rickettsiales bacterium]|nr:lytic transglycosylase domain-containing protein [Rickettsiales bacterium]
MYGNATYHIQSFRGALATAFLVVALTLLAITQIAKPVSGPSQTALPVLDDEIIIIKSDKSADKGPHTHLLGYNFSDHDLQKYEQAFALQDKGLWEKANDVITHIHDDVLLGALLQQRFMHANYDSSYYELTAWLDNYADMPAADAVYQLANRKKPAKVIIKNKSFPDSKLSGVGTRDGIGGQVMPKAWKAGLDAWQEGEFHTAANIFRTVANAKRISAWHRSAAHFWAYRASKKAGYESRAKHHLIEASTAPYTLYGVLARNALGLTQPLRADLPNLDRQILSIPAVKRAAAYAALNMPDQVDAELRQLYTQLPLQQKRQLITVAAELNMPALQLRMSQMLHKDPERSSGAAYPIPQWIANYDMIVDPALIFAVARQESGFSTTAKSPAGARGVMQVMPATAKYVHKKHLGNSDALSNEDLYDPITNLTLGQHYLKYLSEKPYINGSMIHLVAAYNAGPTTIKGWTKRFANIHDPLLFIEKIPFKETRQYVKQVMTNYVIYHELMHGKSAQGFALINGNWPQMPTKRFASNPQKVAQLSK